MGVLVCKSGSGGHNHGLVGTQIYRHMEALVGTQGYIHAGFWYAGTQVYRYTEALVGTQGYSHTEAHRVTAIRRLS